MIRFSVPAGQIPWWPLARAGAFLLVLHSALLAGALAHVSTRYPAAFDYGAGAVGAVLGTLLGIYLLVRLPRSSAAHILAATVVTFSELSVVLYGERVIDGSFLGVALAELVDRIGEGPEPLLAAAFYAAPYWLAQLSFIGMVLFATRFPRPLAPTDLWVRARRKREPGRVRAAGIAARSILLRPGILVLTIGAVTYGATLFAWWVENLINVVTALLALSYFLDGMAVAGKEDRSRLSWVLSAFVLGVVLASAETLYVTLLRAAVFLGFELHPFEPLAVALDFMAQASAPCAFILLAVALLGRGAMDPALVVRRLSWVLSAFVLGVVLASAETLYVTVLRAAVFLGFELHSFEPLAVALDFMAQASAPCAFILLAVALLGRGAMDPGLVVRRTVVLSTLGVIATLCFGVAQDVFAGWTLARAGLPDLLSSVVAAVVVLVVLPPLRWLLERSLGTSAAAQITRRLKESERRETLLLSAEFAGYQRALAVDTAAALQAVELLRRSAERTRGRVVRASGDGVLLEFSSAEYAVLDALEVHRTLASVGNAPALRIALHHGEVVPGPDGDLLGEAPPEAEALRRLARPGDIVLSEPFMEQPGVRTLVHVRPGDADAATHHVLVGCNAAVGAAPARLAGRLRAALAGSAAIVLLTVVLVSASGPAAPPAGTGSEADSMFERGTRLSRTAARRLEASVRAGTADLQTHALLFRYHRANRIAEWSGHVESLRERKHVEWLIRNHPAEPIHALTWAMSADVGLRDRYAMLWREQAELHPASADVQFNAARFLARTPDPTATARLLEGRRRFPTEVRWALQLGIGRAQEFDARAGDSARRNAARDEALAWFDTALALQPSRAEELRVRQWYIQLLTAAGDTAAAAPHAERLVQLARDSAEAWSRNLAHQVLGLLALKAGDIAAAERHLAASHPRWGTWGVPRMKLAAALLERGARAPVLDYLHACADATALPRTRRTIERWIRQVERGETPSFVGY